MKKLLLICSIFLFGNQFVYAQNLAAGDIAMIGYRTDNNDGFTFITLRDIPASEVIYFTDQGWTGFAWYVNSEDHLIWTAPGTVVNIGTVIHIEESSSNNLQATIGSIGFASGFSGWSMSSGDQIIAYQSGSGARPSNPTFITGIHGDDNFVHTTGCEDAVTKWFSPLGACTPAGPSPLTGGVSSMLPSGLTNGVNAVALFPSPKTELDNMKYTGTLVGSADAIRASINDHTKWAGSDNGSLIPITSGDYGIITITPSVTCTAPDVPVVTFSPGTICAGNSALLSISGNKNDATTWQVYTGSCGGTLVGSTTGSSVIVTPTMPSTIYFVGGVGGCVTPGSCGQVTIITTAREDATFNYGSTAYCSNDSDPTPTIGGVTGGIFSSGSGLSLNTSTGTIDVSASTPATYTVTYTTPGLCDNSSNVSVTINGLDDASFSYATNTYAINSSAPSPIISGLLGGSFGSAPAGLSINSGTGIIDLSTSTIGVYTVTYTTSGSCINSFNFSITITASLGIEENLLSNEISIFPNPNKGNFTLSYSGQKQLKELIVIDITGKKVQNMLLGNFANSQEINLTALAKGMYFITIQSESAKATKRIIIK